MAAIAPGIARTLVASPLGAGRRRGVGAVDCVYRRRRRGGWEGLRPVSVDRLPETRRRDRRDLSERAPAGQPELLPGPAAAALLLLPVVSYLRPDSIDLRPTHWELRGSARRRDVGRLR